MRANTIRIRHIMEYFLCSRTGTFGSPRLPRTYASREVLKYQQGASAADLWKRTNFVIPNEISAVPELVLAISIRMATVPDYRDGPGQAPGQSIRSVHVPSNSTRIPSYPGSTFGASFARTSS